MVVWKLHVDLPGTGVIKENWLERASPRERGVIRIEFIYFCVSGFYDYLLFCFDRFVGDYVFVCFWCMFVCGYVFVGVIGRKLERNGREKTLSPRSLKY